MLFVLSTLILNSLNHLCLQWYTQQFFYDLSINKNFEVLLMAVSFLNLCSMALEYYRMPCITESIINVLNVAFTTFFTLEAMVKIIGLRKSYFTDMWCLFHFFVAILSVLSK